MYINKGDFMNTEEYFNQRIDCNVFDCRFHDDQDGRCGLGKILVTGERKKEETFCANFQRKAD